MNPEQQPLTDTVARRTALHNIIAQTKPEDFDGHTEFSRMTAAERLAWLDQAVLFIASRREQQVAEPEQAPYSGLPPLPH